MWKGDEMAVKKKDEAAPVLNVLKFTKEQLVASRKYSGFKDFLNGNLKTDQMYSFEEVDALIEKNYGKVKGE